MIDTKYILEQDVYQLKESVMKNTAENIIIYLKLFVFSFFIYAIYSLIAEPDKFTTKLAAIDKSFEEKGYTWSLKSGQPSFERIERRELDEAALTLDQITQEFSECLTLSNCNAEKQKELAQILSIKTLQNGNAPPVNLTDKWITIFGADKTIEAANYELSRIRSTSYETTLIVRDGWFRSVAVFDTVENATQAQEKISKLIDRNDVYVRYLKSWCPNSTAIQLNEPYPNCR